MARLSKQQQAEIRLKIINTAVELFSEYGFEATTMKQIAREAGIGDATIYKYFANKDKLIYGYYGLMATETAKQFFSRR